MDKVQDHSPPLSQWRGWVINFFPGMLTINLEVSKSHPKTRFRYEIKDKATIDGSGEVFSSNQQYLWMSIIDINNNCTQGRFIITTQNCNT